MSSRSHRTPCPSPRLPKGGAGQSGPRTRASVLGQEDQVRVLPHPISWTARVRVGVSGAQPTLLVLTRGYKRGRCTSKERGSRVTRVGVQFSS